MSNLVAQVASFGRKPKSSAVNGAENSAPNSVVSTPRLLKPTTPRFFTPRDVCATQWLSVELERDSKTDPLGVVFDTLPDYFSGVIITEVALGSLAGEAGLKPGDVVHHVGSRVCETVPEVQASLKAIAGVVALTVTRPKILPAGWVCETRQGRAMLSRKTLAVKASSRPTCELKIKTVCGASTGMALSTTSKGHVIVKAVNTDSPFAKHVRAGDKLMSVNGTDFAMNPLGATRALTSTSGTLRVVGTFVPPSTACATKGCECCRSLLTVSAPSGPMRCGSVKIGVDGKFVMENAPSGMGIKLMEMEMKKARQEAAEAATGGGKAEAPSVKMPQAAEALAKKEASAEDVTAQVAEGVELEAAAVAAATADFVGTAVAAPTEADAEAVAEGETGESPPVERRKSILESIASAVVDAVGLGHDDTAAAEEALAEVTSASPVQRI